VAPLLPGSSARFCTGRSRGESVSGVIDRVFFSDPPELKGEFAELFASLFDNSSVHKRIISLVAGTKAGLIRTEIDSLRAQFSAVREQLERESLAT
jgi:hypothetical protein